MFARVNRSFRDLKEGVDRKEGEVFELAPERFAEINRKLNSYIAECGAPEDGGKPAAKPRAKRRMPANKAKQAEDK